MRSAIRILAAVLGTAVACQSCSYPTTQTYVAGIVVDSEGHPVAGATVEMTECGVMLDMPKVSVITSEDGRFWARVRHKAKPGQIQLRTYKAGYEEAIIKVEAGRTHQNIRIVLHRTRRTEVRK